MNLRSRIPLTLAAAVSAAMLMGCPPVPNKPSTTQSTKPIAHANPAKVLPEAPSIGFEPVAKGVYVPVPRGVMSDEELVRAHLPRDQVFKYLMKVQAPATAPAEAASVPATRPAGETPTLAIKYYLQGRARFLEGANSEAMTALEKALQLDPDAFTVLRLMGRVCFSGAQLGRGVMYLDRAHALHPADVEVNYLLGRYWLDRGDFNRAAALLIQATESPEKQITSTQTPLSSFYLAIALQQGGFNLAAAKEFEHFLDVSQLPIAGYRYDVELGYLINMDWSSHLAAAENDMRAGDTKAALAHYKTAAAARPDDAFIASRLVNALMRDGQGESARQTALGLLTATRGSDDSIKLVEWTFEAMGRKADMIRDITSFLNTPPAAGKKTEAQQESQAITLAAALDYLGKKNDAFTTLLTFSQAHPARLAALERLLKRVDSADTFGKGLNAAARAIAANPRVADDVLRMFSPVIESPAGAAYLKTHPPAKGDFAQLYLLALTRRAQDDSAEAVEQSLRESARTSPPEFFAARQALIVQLLGEEKFAEADQLIQQATQSPNAGEKVWQLRIQSEMAQQRFVSAMALARDAKARFPQNADIRVQLVTLYRLRAMDKDADAELEALVRDLPKAEVGYRLLTNSIFNRGRRGGTQETATTAVIALINKLLQEVPDSRYARIAAAIVYARQQRFDDAETVLRSVLSTDPDNADALVPLAQIRQIAGKPDATTLLENALKQKPNLDVAKALAAIYREQQRPADALALAQRLANENGDAEAYASLYVTELLAQDKAKDAVQFLADLQKRFPRTQSIALTLARVKEQTGDLEGAVMSLRDFMKANGESTESLYLLSHFYADAGAHDASVTALQHVLMIMPDNIGANNDLGYFWANAGIHLEQAETMIRKALENKPDDPAFLDSLGWLYYKEGKFNDAATLLERAVALPGGTQPEVIRHLGDTLYRLNRVPEAIECWAQAVQRLSLSESLTRADRDERDYLNNVLGEARAGRPAAVSPLAAPDPAKAASAIPPSARAAQ